MSMEQESKEHTSINATHKKWNGKVFRMVKNNLPCSVEKKLEPRFANSSILA